MNDAGDPANATPPAEEAEADQRAAMPTSSLARGARLLSVPLGVAGRSAVGAGRRLLGASADEVNVAIRRQTAEQLFAVLGELKGGAMKFGQALSLFEAMLPDDIAAPFRQHLAQLQDSAPPMPSARVQGVLRAELGPSWRSLFSQIDLRPAAAASIGQVHRGIWRETGEPVAIKVQYPGADAALHSDLRQIERLAGAASPLLGGVDVVSLTREVRSRISEEVDYLKEAANQRRAAEAFAGDPEFFVPSVLAATERVLVTSWVDGQRLREVAHWSPERRNLIGLRYVRWLFSGPARAALLHGDPHPGNYLVLPDGRLGILDFGLVAPMPDGLPESMGRLIRLAVDGHADQVSSGLAAENFLATSVDSAALLDYLSPFVEPAQQDVFHFTREWMQGQFQRVMASTGPDGVALKLNIPPSYALIYRVWMGGIAVLSQLDVSAPFGDVLSELLPGFAAPQAATGDAG